MKCQPGQRRSRRISRRPQQSRGVVLIVVLVLVVMVALAGFGFLNSMSTEYAATRLNGDQLQSLQTLASAEALLSAMVSMSPVQREAMGGLRSNPAMFRGRLVQPLIPSLTGTSADSQHGTAGQPDARWRFAIVSTESSAEQGTVLRFGLQNESERLNLASVLRWEQRSPGTGRTALMQLPGMTEEIADGILDWIDADDQPREFGAESEYYLQLDQPYRPPNRMLTTIHELLFVRGMSRSGLLGLTDSAQAAVSGSADGTAAAQAALLNSSSGGSVDSFSTDPMAVQAGWQQYLTLHSAERNVDRSGRPRINLNGDSLSLLEQELTELLSEELVRFILLARVYGLSASASAGGAAPSSAPYASSMKPSFLLTSPGDLIDASIQIQTSAGTILVGSPLRDTESDFPENLEVLLDRTTTSAATSIPGRVNVNQADELVLRAVPGLSSELVSRIVSERQALDQSELRTITWLLTRNILDTVQFRQLSGELTAGGDIWRGELIVFRGIGGPVIRRRLIIDGTGTPPKRLDWEDHSDAASPWPISVLMPLVENTAALQ